MKTGILTFHCVDNYGAMLQAYGLKTFLKTVEPDTEIVPYAPFFMRGRDWLIPWYPGISLIKMIGLTVRNLLTLTPDYFVQKKRMKTFRTRYLTQSLRQVRTLKGLKNLTYEAYVLGSDQIWNPAITFGLRKAYFGAFSNRYKKLVIVYAASLGGSSLDESYDQEMCSLLSYADRISVREKAAVPYVRRLAKKEVLAVVDPVFLLDVDEWKKIEVLPKKRNYILVYKTEKNEKLIDGFIYRFYKDSDIKSLFYILSEMFKKGMKLEDLFYEKRNSDVTKIIQGVYDYISGSKYKINSSGFSFMISNPLKGGANKRMNMFLRWMTRGGVVDFDVFDFIDKKDLIIPLDVHSGNVSRKLGLLKRNQNDIKAAVELTSKLKEFNPNDPSGYDFSLFGAGVNGDKTIQVCQI